MDISFGTQALKYEYENRNLITLHVIVSSKHVSDYGEGPLPATYTRGISGFMRQMRDELLLIMDLPTFEEKFVKGDFPVMAANLEMSEDTAKAHWHIVFFTHERAQQRIKDFITSKTKSPGGYIATRLKSIFQHYCNIQKYTVVGDGSLGIPTVKYDASMMGISVQKPDVKKLSILDYIIKEGVNNFIMTGLYPVDNVDFDIWETQTRSGFYRKNCSGDKPEGGVRAIFPGKSGPLAKRVAPDNTLDIDACVSHFVSLGFAPPEDKFRIYLYREKGMTTFNKQNYELIKGLVREQLPTDALPNPKPLVTVKLQGYALKWDEISKEVTTNRQNLNPDFFYQRTYLKNAVKVLNSPYLGVIFRWISEFLLVDQEERESQKNKALIIKGGSNCGKSAFMELIFRDDIFAARGLSMNSKYATEGMYRSECKLWIYRDINRSLSPENMLEFQSMIDGDEIKREIFKGEMHNIVLARPIVAATTADLVKKFGTLTKEHELEDRVKQFTNRVELVEFPPGIAKPRNGKIYHVSDLLMFLIYPDQLRLPKWTPFYLFWSHYFKNEACLKDKATLSVVDFDDLLSVEHCFDQDDELASLLNEYTQSPQRETGTLSVFDPFKEE